MKIILTGATGFVGEGVLLACLNNPQVEKALMVNRRHFELQHPKLEELIVSDFFSLDHFAAQLSGYDTCFYCAGISSVGMNEEKYSHTTFDITMAFANSLLKANKNINFCFISGSHTDGSEKGKIMWARVKGKTENALMQLPFAKEFNFRPGGMLPMTNQKNAKPLYVYLVKIVKFFSPKNVSTLQEVALAMINAVAKGYPKQVLEIKDIKILANEAH